MKKSSTFYIFALLVFISIGEVGLTVFLTHKFGAKLTYSAFLITTLTGLIIDWVRLPKFKVNLKIFKKYTVDSSASKKEFYDNIPHEYFYSMIEVFSYVLSIILFLVPGFITDALGFLVLTPFIRNYFKKKSTEAAQKKKKYLNNAETNSY